MTTDPNITFLGRARGAPDVFDAWAREGRMDKMGEGHLATAQTVLDAIDPPRRGVFLDVGCGVGWAARRTKVRRGDLTVLAFDAGADVVTRARGAADLVFRADATRIPVRDGAVHAAFSMEVLYYLARPRDALVEIHRTLATGGTFDLMVDYYEENPYSEDWPERVGVPMTRWTAPRWRRAFEEAGFVDVGSQQVKPDPEAAKHRAYDDPEWAAWAREAGSLHVTGRRP